MSARAKEWGVTMPIAGAVYVRVKAESKKAAIEAAWAAAEELICSWSTPDTADGELCELDVIESTGEGNVTHLRYNHAEAEEI